MAALEPGALFPSVSLEDENGERAGLPKGEVLYGFFKTTCPTCELAWPFLERIRRIGDGSLPVVAVSQDDPSETGEFNRRLGVGIPTVFDPEPWKGSDAVGLENVPTFFLVGEDGKILETVVGFQRGKMEDLAKRAADRAGRPMPGASLFLAGETAPALRPG